MNIEIKYIKTLTLLEDVFKQMREKHSKMIFVISSLNHSLVINNVDFSIHIEDSEYDSVRITKNLKDIYRPLRNGLDSESIVVNNKKIFIEVFNEFMDMYGIICNIKDDVTMVKRIVKLVEMEIAKREISKGS